MEMACLLYYCTFFNKTLTIFFFHVFHKWLIRVAHCRGDCYKIVCWKLEVGRMWFFFLFLSWEGCDSWVMARGWYILWYYQSFLMEYLDFLFLLAEPADMLNSRWKSDSVDTEGQITRHNVSTDTGSHNKHSHNNGSKGIEVNGSNLLMTCYTGDRL